MAVAVGLQQGVEQAINQYSNLTASWIGELRPFAIAGVTLYFIFMGFAMAHGTVRESAHTLLWRIFKIALISTIALNINNYNNYIRDGIRGLERIAVQLFSERDHTMIGDLYSPDNQPNQALSSEIGKLIDHKIKLIEHIARYFYKQATEPEIPDLPLLLAGLMCSLCQIMIVSAALIPFLVAKATLAILLSVGPFFILLAIWPGTQRFSEAWLSACLTAILTTALVIIIVGIAPSYTGYYVQTAFNVDPNNLLLDPTNTQDTLTKVSELVIVTIVLNWLTWKIVFLSTSLINTNRFGQAINTVAHTALSYLDNSNARRSTYVSNPSSMVAYPFQTSGNTHYAHQHVIRKIQRHD